MKRTPVLIILNSKNYNGKRCVSKGKRHVANVKKLLKMFAQAIFELTDELKLRWTINTCGLFLNFSKALDTVDHKILLEKLQKYGIRGVPLQWFTSYLTNCQQYVRIDNTDSEMLRTTCGVPQGSTLGPLLFLFYINDMPNCSKKLSFRIFADDTTFLLM